MRKATLREYIHLLQQGYSVFAYLPTSFGRYRIIGVTPDYWVKTTHGRSFACTPDTTVYLQVWVKDNR